MSTKKLIRTLRAEGWSVEYTGSNHLICRHPDAAYPVVTSCTPRVPDRHLTKVRADMRRSLQAGKKPP